MVSIIVSNMKNGVSFNNVDAYVSISGAISFIAVANIGYIAIKAIITINVDNNAIIVNCPLLLAEYNLFIFLIYSSSK